MARGTSAGRETRSAEAAGTHRRANRAGPVVGWAWREARDAVQFGKKEGACSVVLKKNGEARFNFWVAQPPVAADRQQVAGR